MDVIISLLLIDFIIFIIYHYYKQDTRYSLFALNIKKRFSTGGPCDQYSHIASEEYQSVLKGADRIYSTEATMCALDSSLKPTARYTVWEEDGSQGAATSYFGP